MKITITADRDNLLSEHAKRLLKEFYQLDTEQSPQDAYARAAEAWSGGDEALAQRIYDAASQNWFVFASPLLSNAPTSGSTARGLPISCFLTYVGDNLSSIIEHSTETRWLSVKGGGVGGHWSDVRAVSDVAPGPIPFIHTIDADTIAYRQGKTRKGSYAAYIDISHPDVVEFIHLRVPTGDSNRKSLNIHHGVNISDAFMAAVQSGQPWKLVCPKSGETRDVIPARQLWEQILEIRYRTGEPYLNYIDTANRELPTALKKLGLKIHGSNLCNEIHLPTNEDRTAVCCLSSLNLEHYDEWKSTNLIADLIRMLDNVISYFVERAPRELSKAVYSANQERSVGLGAMGFHSYLQSRNIAFESIEAGNINEAIFKEIKEKAVQESKSLAKERGEAPDMKGTGLRNAHLLAIAPNANSSIIADTSPSIEPYHANAFVHRTRAGSYLVRNRYLEKALDVAGKNTNETWNSIIASNGSVQHLEFLDAATKAVFRTAMEIDQDWVVRHASARQKYICQGQSVNLFFHARTDRAYINRIHMKAWRDGLKGLYYLRTEAASRAEEVGTKVTRVELKNAEEAPVICGTVSREECVACAV